MSTQMTKTVTGRLAVTGALYHLLAGALAYPTAARREECADGTLAGALADAAGALGDDGLRATVDALGHALAAADGQGCGLAEEYTYLFARQVQVPCYESRYLPAGSTGQPQDLADVGGIYAAFGFRTSGDMPDHVGAELEFTGALCLKEAYAREQGWAEQADICHQARRQFVAEHLRRWLPAFAARLHDKARLPVYPALADAILALVAWDSAVLGLDAAPVAVAAVQPPLPEDDGQCAR